MTVFSTEAEIARQRRINLRNGEAQLVILGDGRGTQQKNLYAPPNRMWVRWIGSRGEDGYSTSGLPFTALAGTNYPVEINFAVYLKWDKVRGYMIDGPDPDHMTSTGRDMALLNPLDAQNQFHTQEQIITLQAYPVGGPSMKVAVREWIYRLQDNTHSIWPGSNITTRPHVDLTSSVPATANHHRYALIVFNITEHQLGNNPLQVVVSTSKDKGTALTDTDRIQCLNGMANSRCVPIRVFRLLNGQTSVRGHRDDRDMRMFCQVPLAIPNNFITTAMIQDAAITLPKFATTALKVTTTAPTINDDSADGYGVGTHWINTTTDKEYVCVDATVGAAVWTETTGGGVTAAKYLIQVADAGLPNAQVMGVLGTGLVKNTTATGVQSIAAAGTDYTSPSGTENLSNKTITASSLIATALSLIIGGFKAIFTHANSADRTYTLPNYDGTLATLAGSETFDNKTINTSSIGTTTPGAGYFSALRLKIGGFFGIFTHANSADRTYTLPNYNATLSPSTTKGDIAAFNGTDNTRLPVDSDGLYVTADSSAATGLAYTPGSLDVTGATGESWVARDNLYLDITSNTWFKIDTNAVPPKISDIRGAALTAATHPASGQRIRREGIVSGYSGLTAGLPLYASTTAGGYTQTKPSVTAGGGQIVVVEIGYAISATTAFIDKDNPIEFLKRDWLSNGETIEIEHNSDPQGRLREPFAYLASNTEVIAEQCVTSDTDVPLKRRSTGSTVTVDAAGASGSTVGDSAGTDFRLGQQFEVTTSGYVSTIAFLTGPTTGTPSAFPSYRIETNNPSLNIPSGTAVTNSSGTMSAWTASATNTITYISPGPYLVTGTKYWFILELPMQATNVNYTVARNAAGAYADGVMKWDTTTGASFPDTWAGGGGTNDMRVAITTVVMNANIGQGTTLSSTIDITRVELYLKRTGALTGEILNVELWLGTGSGQPLSAIHTSENVNAPDVGATAAYINFPFLIPVSSSLGTEWFIVLKSTGIGSATAYIDWVVDTTSPPYADGVFVTRRGTTWANLSPDSDGRFILYAVGTYFDVPIAVGLGSTAMETHYGDTSYASQDTKTTFENIYGSLMDATVKVRMG